ncbi:hypothetical protein PFISCL1PPCAC_11022, partial [Pristionchus fissidentatus]
SEMLKLLLLFLLIVFSVQSAKLQDCKWEGHGPICKGAKCASPQHVIMDMRKKDDMDPTFGMACAIGAKIKCCI